MPRLRLRYVPRVLAVCGVCRLPMCHRLAAGQHRTAPPTREEFDITAQAVSSFLPVPATHPGLTAMVGELASRASIPTPRLWIPEGRGAERLRRRVHRKRRT